MENEMVIGNFEQLIENDTASTISGTGNRLDHNLFNIPVHANTPMFGTFLILLNTAIGSGTLMVPYCYKLGVFFSLIVAIVFAVVAYFSMHFMIDAGYYSKTYDYRGLFAHTFGYNKLWIINTMIFLVQFGACMIYAHWNGRLMNKLVGSKNVILGSNTFWIFLISTLCVFPLTLFRTLAKLEKFEMLSSVFIFVIISHSVYWFIKGVLKEGFDPNHRIKYFDMSSILINALSVNSMAFNCHINLFPCLEHLKDCTVRRARKLAGITICVSFTLYTTFGLFTYLHLFDNLGTGSALEYYPKSNYFTFITIVGVIVTLIMSAPLVIWAARNSIDHIIWGENEPSSLRWVLVGGTIVLLTSALASTSDNILLFFDIVGGLFTPTIIFLMPSIFYLKNCPSLSALQKTGAIIIGLFTIIAAVSCTYHAITEIIESF